MKNEIGELGLESSSEAGKEDVPNFAGGNDKDPTVKNKRKSSCAWDGLRLSKEKQMIISTLLEKKAREKLCVVIFNFFCHCAIPFYIFESPFLAKLIEGAKEFGGKRLKLPSKYGLICKL